MTDRPDEPSDTDVGRRTVLAAAATLPLAGCAANQTGAETATPKSDTTAAIEDAMEAAGIDVVDATVTDQGHDLAYRSAYTETPMAVVEVATVASVYADLVEDYDLDLFAPFIVEGGGDIVRYTIEESWAEEYNAGERTQVEYLDRIMDYMVGYNGGEI